MSLQTDAEVRELEAGESSPCLPHLVDDPGQGPRDCFGHGEPGRRGHRRGHRLAEPGLRVEVRGIRVQQLPRAQAGVMKMLKTPVYDPQALTPPLLVDRVPPVQAAAGEAAQHGQHAVRGGHGQSAAERAHRLAGVDPAAAQVGGDRQTGLDRLATFRDIWRELPMDKGITMCAWRVPRAEVPEGIDARAVWLFDWFARIDAWIDAHPELDR